MATINNGVLRVQIVDAEGNERDDEEVALRFTADTTDVDRKLGKTKDNIRAVVDDANRGLLLADRINRISGGLAGAAVAGAVGTRRGRTVARTVAQGTFRAGAVGAGRAVAAGGIGALGSLLIPLAGIAAGIASLVIIGRASSKAADKQAAVLSQILIQSRQQTTSIQTLQAAQRREQDPFQRGIGFQRNRIAALGVGITSNQVRTAGDLQNATNELMESREALSRSFSIFAAPLKTIATDIKAATNRGINRAVRGTQEFFGGDQNATLPQGGGFFKANMALLKDLSGIPFLAGGANPRAGDLSTFFGRDNSEAPMPSGLTEAQQRSRNLFQLQHRGAPNIQAPSATIRAGGDSEYQFKVQRQRLGIQQKLTQEWQQEVVALLRLMARDDQGGITNEDVFRTRVQFGMEGVN